MEVHPVWGVCDEGGSHERGRILTSECERKLLYVHCGNEWVAHAFTDSELRAEADGREIEDYSGTSSEHVI